MSDKEQLTYSGSTMYTCRVMLNYVHIAKVDVPRDWRCNRCTLSEAYVHVQYTSLYVLQLYVPEVFLSWLAHLS